MSVHRLTFTHGRGHWSEAADGSEFAIFEPEPPREDGGWCIYQFSRGGDSGALLRTADEWRVALYFVRSRLSMIEAEREVAA